MKKLFLLPCLFVFAFGHAQVRFSVGTDVSLLRNFSKSQSFWSVGQGLQANIHLSSKNSFYAWLCYYLPSSFSNQFIATAKSPLTSPQSVPFSVKGKWKYNQVSLGIKHYFRGSAYAEGGLNFYGQAGFGLVFANIENSYTNAPDSNLYNLAAPQSGSSTFRRLTLDLGLGAEVPVGGNFFIYGDLRGWVFTSETSSPFFHVNNGSSLPLMFSVGLRILFGDAPE